MIKKLLTSLFTLILMGLATALAIPFLIPAEEYKQIALEFLEKKTGREVKVEGEIHFALLPDISLEIDQVTIANPPQGFTSPHLLKIEKLSLSVALSPLFSKEIQVQGIRLIKPEIWLEENRIGNKNWEFKTTSAEKSSSSSSTAASKLSYNIEGVQISEGNLHFLRKGDNLLAEKLNADWSDNKLGMSGAMNYRGTPWQFAGTLKQPQAALMGQKSPLSLLLESPAISIMLDGEMQAKAEDIARSAKITGKLNINAPDMTELAKSLQIASSNLPKGAFSLQTIKAELSTAYFTASPASLTLGDIEATGTIGANWSGKRPVIQAALAIPELDFSEETTPAASANKDTEATSSTGWNTTPVDFSGLQKATLEGELTVQTLKLPELTLRDIQTTAKLKNGKLQMHLAKANLLGGGASGTLQLDASASQASWQTEGTIENIESSEALGLVLEDSAISGPISAKFALAAVGNSQQQWMQRLHGGGQMLLDKGTLKGYSLPKLFRNMKPEEMRGEATQDTTIKLQFLADNGVISLTEGTLEGRGLKSTLSGVVDMGNRRVDLLLRPKILPQYDADNIETGEAANLMVPLKVVGRFGHISVRPDAKAALVDALQNPEQAKQNVEILKNEGKAILENLKGQKKSIDGQWKDLKKNKGADVD